MGGVQDPEGREEGENQAQNLGTSGEQQILASLKICLEESHKIRHWREERPKKAGNERIIHLLQDQKRFITTISKIVRRPAWTKE